MNVSVSTQLSIPVDLAPRGWYGLALQALDTAKEQWSENTRKAYRLSLQSWREWCWAYGDVPDPPIEPEKLVAWAQWQHSNDYARSTIYLHLAAVSWLQTWHWARTGEGVATLGDHPLVRSWKKGFRRQVPAYRSQAHCPTAQDLERIVHALWTQPRGKGPRRGDAIMARDRAMILLAYYGALRRSELVALDVRNVTLTGRSVAIFIAHSKTDQTGIGETRDLLPQSSTSMCPIDAWRAWIELYQPQPEEPAFPAIGPAGTIRRGVRVTPEAFAYCVSHRSVLAGVPRITPHSLRAAFATHASELHDEAEIAYHGRWKSRAVMQRYVRRGSAWKKNPTSGLAGRRET